MAYTNFSLTIDAGIAHIVWDMPGKSMNVIDISVMDELDELIDKVAGDATLKGAVITSGKPAFSGGADLTMLEGLLRDFHAKRAKDPEGAAQLLFDGSRRLSQIFRKLETCGKPFVAALNGTCMGGATELALACHARIAAEEDVFKMALPEVKVGLFPGGELDLDAVAVGVVEVDRPGVAVVDLLDDLTFSSTRGHRSLEAVKVNHHQVEGWNAVLL